MPGVAPGDKPLPADAAPPLTDGLPNATLPGAVGPPGAPPADGVLDADALAAARLDGVLLAGRTVAHLVNNDLTIAVSALDLLRAHGDLPPHLHGLLDSALGGLYAAAEHVDQVRRITRVVIVESPAGPALDLDRSRG